MQNSNEILKSKSKLIIHLNTNTHTQTHTQIQYTTRVHHYKKQFANTTYSLALKYSTIGTYITVTTFGNRSLLIYIYIYIYIHTQPSDIIQPTFKYLLNSYLTQQLKGTDH